MPIICICGYRDVLSPIKDIRDRRGMNVRDSRLGHWFMQKPVFDGCKNIVNPLKESAMRHIGFRIAS